MSKETFKEFIKRKPELAQAVFNNKTTFQKLYEAYDMYGEDNTIFNELLKEKTTDKEVITPTFKEITNLFRNIDLDTVQKSVNGLQKAVNLISEIVPQNNNQVEPNYNYEERPINKYYED